MPLTSTQLTGLVLGILLPMLLIALFSFLILRYRRNDSRIPSNTGSEAGIPEPNPALGTVRRQTGEPQTFADWIQASSPDEAYRGGKGGVIARGERWPSLEHGPGPIIINSHSCLRASSPLPADAAAAAVSDENGIKEGAAAVNKSIRKRSIDESSLREAVLGFDATKEEVGRKEGEEKIRHEKDKAEGEAQIRKTRVYSGAWP